jgi:uncharacterized protein (TIGR03437 family)
MTCKRTMLLLAVTASTACAQCYEFSGSGATLKVDITDFTLKSGPTFTGGGAYSTNDRFEGTNTFTAGGSTKTSQSTANTPECVECEIGTITLSYSAGALTVFTLTVPTNTEPSMEYWGVTLGGSGNPIPSGLLPQPAAFPPISSWGVNAEIQVATDTGFTVYPITSIGACSSTGGGSPAESTTVVVNGNQGPWEQSLNPSFNYGDDGTNTAPTVISASSGIPFTIGGTLTVTYVSGLVNVFPEGGYTATDANGYSGNATNKQVIATYGSYPSYFMNASSYPVYASELVGTFANNGAIVGTPFPIGDGPASFIIPAGANQLLLGVDDNDYADNTGSWTLSVSYAPLVVSHVLNGASYQPGIVPGSMATIYGTNLSLVKDGWEKYIVDGKYPTTMDDVTVTIGGKPAYLSYISSEQINLIVPEVGSGPQDVVVKNAKGSSAAFESTVSATGPAFLLWPKNQAVATLVNYDLAAESGTFPGAVTTPAKPGDVVILWGTGFGPTIPADPIGEETPSKGTYSTSTLPKVTLNGVAVTVYGAALAAGDGGLYQIAIQVPSTMANGNWPVRATIGGVQSPSGVLLAVEQ